MKRVFVFSILLASAILFASLLTVDLEVSANGSPYTTLNGNAVSVDRTVPVG